MPSVLDHRPITQAEAEGPAVRSRCHLEALPSARDRVGGAARGRRGLHLQPMGCPDQSHVERLRPYLIANHCSPLAGSRKCWARRRRWSLRGWQLSNCLDDTMPRRTPRVPKLPQLLDRKIYKTGQTRGADDDEIYQNRVSRTSTVLIPYGFWERCRQTYERGHIVLISPEEYFALVDAENSLAAQGIVLGTNGLVFYETREQWNKWNPHTLGWTPANSREAPLGGSYVARIPATTASENGEKINHGFTGTSMKGAGIRVYEYSSEKTIAECRLQLEAFFWMCEDSEVVALHNGMSAAETQARRSDNLTKCSAADLLDIERLKAARILDDSGHTICPLCLERLSAQGFFNRMEQAEGRQVSDLTITQLNLFHIAELRVGVLNHRPYNLGWGHHHCNVVVKDSGILETLEWMREVVDRNIRDGHLPPVDPKSAI